MENNRSLKKPDNTVKLSRPASSPDISKSSHGASNDKPSTKTQNPLISEHCVKYLNYRIQQEEFSSRIYMSMAMWLTNEGYDGAGGLWKKYSAEEMTHADWAREYLLSFGIQPVTARLDQPMQNFTGLPEIIQLSYEHEIEVSSQIKQMADEALKLGDHMIYELALRYLKEQVEEHNKMQNWVDQLASFGTDKIALRLLDNVMKG